MLERISTGSGMGIIGSGIWAWTTWVFYFGGFFLVNNIGTSDNDMNKETSING